MPDCTFDEATHDWCKWPGCFSYAHSEFCWDDKQIRACKVHYEILSQSDSPQALIDAANRLVDDAIKGEQS